MSMEQRIAEAIHPGCYDLKIGTIFFHIYESVTQRAHEDKDVILPGEEAGDWSEDMIHGCGCGRDYTALAWLGEFFVVLGSLMLKQSRMITTPEGSARYNKIMQEAEARRKS